MTPGWVTRWGRPPEAVCAVLCVLVEVLQAVAATATTASTTATATAAAAGVSVTAVAGGADDGGAWNSYQALAEFTPLVVQVLEQLQARITGTQQMPTAAAAAAAAGGAPGMSLEQQQRQQQHQQHEEEGVVMGLGFSWLAEIEAAEEQLCIWILRGWRALLALPAAAAPLAEVQLAVAMQQITELALTGTLGAAAAAAGVGGGKGGGGGGSVGAFAEAAAAAAVRAVSVVLSWGEESSICGEARLVLKELALWPRGEWGLGG